MTGYVLKFTKTFLARMKLIPRQIYKKKAFKQSQPLGRSEFIIAPAQESTRFYNSLPFANKKPSNSGRTEVKQFSSKNGDERDPRGLFKEIPLV